MIPFVQDWHFDPDYDQATKDWLAEGLDRPFTEWLKKSYLKIQSLFVTYPERKNAALAEAGDIAELACGAPVCRLMFLSCGRKSPIPTQCAIFVGGKAFISGHRNRCRRQASDVALFISDWFRVSFMVFLSSECRTLMGFQSVGEWKSHAIQAFKSILHLTVRNSLKTQSPIPDWGLQKIKESWNVQ